MENNGVRKQIRNFLLLVTLSVFSAIAAAMFLIMYYGPSGSYMARDVLLSPEVMTVVNYNDTHPTTGAITRFVFDTIEFNYFDPATKRWRTMQVGMGEYAKLYQLLLNDRSETPVSEEMQRLFNTANPATLTIRVRPEYDKGDLHASKVFQQVVFVNAGNAYRVQLREGQQQDIWAYYNHKNIYERVMHLLIP